MAAIIDLTGKRFGRWRVVKLSHQVGKMLYWSCICECGTKRAVFGGDLKRGGSLSCGCLAREQRRERATSHGMAHHPAYRSWIYMHDRCNNPRNTMSHLYGGRGITVCKRWNDFQAFWKDMGPTWAPGLTLDRINNNQGYKPGNCRWATRSEQAANRRTNHLIQTPDGKMTIAEAARAFGVGSMTIISRIRYGWPEEHLLFPPRKVKGMKK
jgi:hypothetical protein